jgi:hypothetical protein
LNGLDNLRTVRRRKVFCAVPADSFTFVVALFYDGLVVRFFVNTSVSKNMSAEALQCLLLFRLQVRRV